MPRRASPYLYKVSGVRKRHTLRTGNTCTSKHVTIATTLGEAARDAEMTARASLGLSPLHPPPLHPLPGMMRKLRRMLLRRAPAMHHTGIARAASHRCAGVAGRAATSQGRPPGHRRQRRGQWPSERPRKAVEHGPPFFRQTGSSREKLLEGLRKLGKEEIRLRSLLRGPGYGVTANQHAAVRHENATRL